MNRADLFVYYDTVQFMRRSWHCRTYISDHSRARWLSAPVLTEGGSRRLLCTMKWADDHPWRSKMARRLEHCYANAKESAGLDEMLQLVRLGSPMLTDWNIAANAILARLLGITTPMVRASHLSSVVGDKQDRIIRLCQDLGATHYICGPGSKVYVNDSDFARSGITVEWLTYDYQHRLLTNQGREVFPSSLDLILTEGREAARRELKSRESVQTRHKP